nr:Ig-like domain-containing protein [uncultured Blautia sp.]
MKKWKKILISLITVFVLAILPAESAILPGTVCVTEAAPRISSSKLTMIKGQSRTLKITGLKKGQKITWKSSNSKIVAVNKAGKLFAKSAGNATITAQVNGIAPKPGIKLKNHILSKGKKASDGSVKIELNTHDESKKIDMDLGGLGSSSSSMQVSVDEYRSITYIPKNNSFKFYFRFSSHDDLKSDITLTFPMNSTAASLNFYFYMSILPDDESGTLIATMSSSAPLSAIRNESSNLSFHFQKLTDPYEILTQKDASELANDTLDMAVPYWTDLLKGSGITLRSLGFSTTK